MTIRFNAWSTPGRCVCIPRTSCGGNFCRNALRRKFPPHSRKYAAKKNTPQPQQKCRNTVCSPGISAAFPPMSAAFPPISAANRGVEKTENKFCRNSKITKKNAANQEEMPQIQKGAFFDLRHKFLPQRISRYIGIYACACNHEVLLRRRLNEAPQFYGHGADGYTHTTPAKAGLVMLNNLCTCRQSGFFRDL